MRYALSWSVLASLPCLPPEPRSWSLPSDHCSLSLCFSAQVGLGEINPETGKEITPGYDCFNLVPTAKAFLDGKGLTAANATNYFW